MSRRAVRVVRSRRRAGGCEDGDHAHHVVARVLQAMHNPCRKLDTGAGAHRPIGALGVQHPFAVEHVDDLVIGVEVLGRAGGRDVADEVGRRAQAGVGVGDDPELAVGGRRLGLLVGEPADHGALRAVGPFASGSAGSGIRTQISLSGRSPVLATVYSSPGARYAPLSGSSAWASPPSCSPPSPSKHEQDLLVLARVGAPASRRGRARSRPDAAPGSSSRARPWAARARGKRRRPVEKRWLSRLR